ncbi:hypothetical protein L2E82_16716 [Cichorium intybus]|uniref:Uncharacterized protein n=1 Tax=Cichorium intybus TaxID=13427 RepID=A0ACB9F7L6_CICIN|nr:hypothetical protein L2E82_16716 [Cichorium intybus]
MCYPARVSCVSGYEFEIRIRRLAALAADVNHREVVVMARQQVVVGGGEVARVKKQCLCSPTIHPGSFRCKHHHSDYVWVGRLLAPTPTQHGILGDESGSRTGKSRQRRRGAW